MEGGGQAVPEIRENVTFFTIFDLFFQLCHFQLYIHVPRIPINGDPICLLPCNQGKDP